MWRALVRPPAFPSRRLISGLSLALAATPVGVYLWLAAHRIGYPFELDWLEGGTVELVDRVLQGHGLYAPPGLSYVGFTYTPFYSLLSAGVAQVTGVGFLPLRIVSLASSLIVLLALAMYSGQATGDPVAGAVSAGIFAATYRLCGFFFDVGRLDSSFLAVTLVALGMGRRVQSARGGVVVGGIAFLAFFTKQVGLLACGPALLCAAVLRPRAGIAALLTLGGLVTASTLALDASTEGWYRYYVVGELAGQPQVTSAWVGFWTRDLLGHLPWLAALAVLGAGTSAIGSRRSSRWGRLGLYDAAALLGLLLCAWVSRLHSGGYVNVLMPAYAACALIGGAAVATLRRRKGRWGAGLAFALVALQFGTLLNHAGQALPTRQDATAGRALVAALTRLHGPALVLSHPWYGTQAGKGSFAQSDGINEVLRSHDPRGVRALRRALSGALNRDRIQTVVLDVPAPAWLAPQLAANFQRVPGRLSAGALRPPSDLSSAPSIVYTRVGSR